MRQHLRHFQQNLNLKSILVQETSDNVTTTPDLESLFNRDEDRFYFEDKKKPIKLLNISCNSLESRFLLSLYIYFDDDVDGSVVP